MTTVAAIAEQAFNAVATSITDVIHAATLSYDVSAARGYDHKSGKYFSTTTSMTGRCLFDTVKPASDIFPDYTNGPKDELVLLEGFGVLAKEGWALAVSGETYTIKKAQAIVGVSDLVYAIVRKVA